MTLTVIVVAMIRQIGTLVAEESTADNGGGTTAVQGAWEDACMSLPCIVGQSASFEICDVSEEPPTSGI